MKKRQFVTSVKALFAAALLFSACTTTPNKEEITSLEDIDRKAEALKQAILNTTETPSVKGRIFYVAADGNDQNDGLSPESPLQTIEKVNALDLQPGDGVFFRRGDIFRGVVHAPQGITYSAYGKGPKPKLYASPCNAAREGTWTETDVKGVYAYSLKTDKDVGTLVFNDGAAGCAYKVMMVTHEDGSTTHVETGEPFSTYRDLKRDLDLYHDYKDTGIIYLRSDKGNPAERFSSIELNIKTNLIYASKGVHIDNLCLKYCGVHAIGAGSILTVTNCEIGWVGGSIQGEGIFGRNLPTRYGNGVEIYGGCEDYLVDSCYVYQIYDAAITHQHLGNTEKPIIMKNVRYTNNLVEDCVYAFEYFLGKAANGAEHMMENILIADNIARRAGMGWGIQRPDKETPALVKSWVNYNPAINFVITRNIFDRSACDLLNITADNPAWLPRLEENVYAQYRDAVGGKIGYNAEDRGIEKDPFWNSIKNDNMRYPFNEQFGELLKQTFGEEKGTMLYLEP